MGLSPSIGSVAAHRSDGCGIYVHLYHPYRVVGLAPTRRRRVRFLQRQLDSLRVCLRRRGRNFDAFLMAPLVVVVGIWELEEGHELCLLSSIAR